LAVSSLSTTRSGVALVPGPTSHLLSEEGFRRTKRVGALTLGEALEPVVRELLVPAPVGER
jgi:hypothetical protein